MGFLLALPILIVCKGIAQSVQQVALQEKDNRRLQLP